jgi:hypothetical protein
VTPVSLLALMDELTKVALQLRAPSSPWAPKTIGSPRSKLPSIQFPKAPTAPGNLSPKLVKPAGQFGTRPDYSAPVGPPSGTTNLTQ